MKKLVLLLCCVLLVTGCDLFTCVDELYTVTTEYDASKVTVTPAETTVSKGKVVKLTYTNLQGYVVTEIKVDGNPVEIPSDGILSVPVNSDCVVSFISEEVIEYYTISASCGQNGTISPSGDVSIVKDQDKTFEIVANDEYFVDSLIIDGVGTKTSSATAGITYKFSSISDNHTISVTFRKKESYKIISSASANGVISPLGEVDVTEGQTKTFQTTANEFCSLQKYVVDGVDVNPASSYVFSEISSDHTINAVFKKELEWYLLKITWVRDSLYVDDHRNYVPGSEILNFSADGTYTKFWNNLMLNRTWSLDKTTIPPTLRVDYGPCKIEVLNETKMVISYQYNGSAKETYVYHGVLK